MSRVADDVHNYYEHLLRQSLYSLKLIDTHDEDYIADFCCLVLNQLPTQYVRYDVDMCHFTSRDKHEEMLTKLQHAIDAATAWLDREENKRFNRDR